MIKNRFLQSAFCIGAAILSVPPLLAGSNVASQIFPGESVHSISSNGKWMVSEIDGGWSMLIRNLETGETWTYLSDGLDNGVKYDLAMTQDVADDGTVIAEVSNVPSYWRAGKWTHLPQASGALAALVGGITPDGSVIAGSVSSTSSIRTRPCLWYRQEDGSYGNPVWLPDPVRNSVGGTGAQYVNANAVSADGRKVAVSLRTGSGFNHIPYVYSLGDNGVWSSRAYGESVINPPDLVMPVSPGPYRGPGYPDYESFMTPEEIEKYYEATGGQWISNLYDRGLSEDEIFVEGLLYAANFMSDENRAIYLPLAEAFASAYLPWAKAMAEYQKQLDAVTEQQVDFIFNNVFISPDGKYLYATAYKNIITDPSDPEYGFETVHAPVRFDIETGEPTVFSFDYDALISCVAADYSILGRDYDLDADLYRPAYIFPGTSTEGIQIQEYWKERNNMYAYDWMVENLYQEVLVGFNSNGSYRWDDAWCIGKPVVTPDLSLWGFGTSTLYWSTPPAESAVLTTYLLNPEGENIDIENSAVNAVENNSILLDVLSGGILTISGDADRLEIYDFSGTLLFSAANPSGLVNTNLPPGLYIVRVHSSENSISRKVIF